jgi:hypothetical protein
MDIRDVREIIITSFFASWVDLQEMCLERCGSRSTNISLEITLKTIQIQSCRSGNYCAANNAVKSLVVLSGLIWMTSFNLNLDPFALPLGITRFIAFLVREITVYEQNILWRLGSHRLIVVSSLQNTRPTL